MGVSDITSYADSFRQRVFMGGFLQGTIQNDGTAFHLGTTECAIVEKALRAVDRRESLLIHNPFPTTSLPVAIIASYAYSQNPRIPGNEELPMLVFPASSRGYLSEIDKFHFQTTVSAEDNKTPLIPRESIGSLSEQSASWHVYTAKDNFVFDIENHDVPLGALFIDLRKPEWSERRFDNIEEFCESNPDIPAIFYTEEMNPAAELTQERLGSEPIRVTGEMLANAATTDPAEGESSLTVQERILSSGRLEVLQFPVTDEGLGDHIPEFIGLKKKCQKRDLAYVDVGRVFNRLLKQPFKPKYWSRSVGSNAFYDDVPGYIERLERRAGNVERGSNLLNNYARKANEVQGYLNGRHALQNTVLDAIQRAGDDEGHSRFVVKNTPAKEALRLAATDSGYTIPENVEIIERGKVTPMPDTRYVFLYPPYRDDYVFEFPPSEQVAFIYQALWSNYVQSAAQEATKKITATHKTQSIGEGGAVGDVEDHVFDIDTLESDIEGYLRGVDFGGSDGSSLEESEEAASDGEELIFELTDGSSRRFSEESIVTIYDPEEAKISRKTAKKVDIGEEILLIESVAGDLYDVLLDSAHKRDAVREDEELVANWRRALNNAMEREGLSYEDVVDELQERGSDIESWHSVRAWSEGRYMGPLDEGDCRRVLHLARPDLEGALLEQIHEQVWKAMKHLRLLHRRIGRNVRRAVEAEYNPSTTSSFGSDVNEQMVKNIARNIDRQTITNIEASANE
ncbi:DrmE family protein [Halobellus salinisoli]|uniref:DrmE family protein n=1 Tax=Halobellus salinisoli TaxID=3108500 RepID=UPI003009D11D